MAKQTLAILPDTFTIHSLPVDTPIPAQILGASIYFIGKTREELSVVVADSIEIDSDESDPGWRVLEVLGPLQLSMVGIMARIGSVLANAKVSIFVVSTFETDYFLVKEYDLFRAKEALIKDGYKVVHG
ncbi:ACT domain-containing protein [Aliiglaciecola sp. CAU 1673]|uniref:ACT domain-containing protein n=1 Tax=Aliiglaciecola sp. CAU 1673 TaxID=3032595 RepID=UPI0023DA6777|nr:ACT domain-containing protein [Aliiglaciecola sp. CAU 1673]MDF2177739.1 ACT domain-containing protein [Aliiglaciecola sp. CAU 1673]